MELDLQVSPEEIMSMEVELGCESWTSFASSCSSTAIQRALSLWLCPSTAVETLLCSALVAGQWRGDTALTLPLFWWWFMVSPVSFGRYLRSSLHSFVPSPHPPPPLPVPNKPPRFCERKAIWSARCLWGLGADRHGRSLSGRRRWSWWCRHGEPVWPSGKTVGW